MCPWGRKESHTTKRLSILSKGLSESSSPAPQFESNKSLGLTFFNSHIHTCNTGKTIALTIHTFIGKVMSLLFLIHCLGLS